MRSTRAVNLCSGKMLSKCRCDSRWVFFRRQLFKSCHSLASAHSTGVSHYSSWAVFCCFFAWIAALLTWKICNNLTFWLKILEKKKTHTTLWWLSQWQIFFLVRFYYKCGNIRIVSAALGVKHCKRDKVVHVAVALKQQHWCCCSLEHHNTA